MGITTSAHYPACVTPTKEEDTFPEVSIRVYAVDSALQFDLDDDHLANVSPELGVRLRQMLTKIRRDLTTWLSYERRVLPTALPLTVTLTTHTLAGVNAEKAHVAVASVKQGAVYLNYALLREDIPLGFRLGVFEYIFDCLNESGRHTTRQQILDKFTLPVLIDQIKVLQAPKKYALAPEKDWLDALLAVLAKKHPHPSDYMASYNESKPAAPGQSQTSYQQEAAGLSEKQRRSIEEFSVRNGTQRASLLKKMRTLLTILSTGLGEDVDIKVVPGEWWAYDYESSTITFPLIELVTTSPEVLTGFILHEIGHYQITRIDATDAVFSHFLSAESLRLLLNTFEDARANNWMRTTFRGTAPYFDMIYDDLLSEDLSKTSYAYKLQKEAQKRSNSPIQAYQMLPHVEYLLSVLYYWRFGRSPSSLNSREVKTALDSTVPFFESIFNRYPSGRTSEREKLRYAREAAQEIVDHILGPYEKLLEEARKNVCQAIERGQQPMEEGENPSEIRPQTPEHEAQEIVEEQAKDLADRLSAARALSGSVDAKALEERIAQREDTLDNALISKEKSHSELTRKDLLVQRRRLQLERASSTNEYHRLYARVSGLLHVLVGTLENVLAKNRKPKYEGYYSSGQKPDLRRVMDITRKIHQGMPTTPKDFDVFLKRRRPTHLDHRIMLLLDESGSMQEPKRTAALEAILLFVEAFDYLGINYAIIGFSDAPVIHKPFGDNLSQTERALIVEDVSHFIPIGATADADALALGIELFEQEPEDIYRLIIIISDGEGNINSTGKTFQELQAAAQAKGIRVIGIGIGEATEAISTRYHCPIQVPVVEQLPLTLGDVLQTEVRRDSFQ